MKTKIGIIPLGHSPRPDFVAPLAEAVGKNAEIIQHGALEGLTFAEIMALDRRPDESILHTNLPPDGKLVTFPRRHVHERIPGVLKQFESQGVKIATVCCVEPWSGYEFSGVYLEIRRLVRHFLSAINVKGPGFILHRPEDMPEDAVNRWKDTSDLTIRPFSPAPSEDELNELLDELAELAPKYVVLDCVTYNQELKGKIKLRLDCPVILPLTVLANALREIVCV